MGFMSVPHPGTPVPKEEAESVKPAAADPAIQATGKKAKSEQQQSGTENSPNK